MTALLLLGPWTPLALSRRRIRRFHAVSLFQRRWRRQIARGGKRGRFAFFGAISICRIQDVQARLAAPYEIETFNRCKLDWNEGKKPLSDLHRDLIKLRREDSRLRLQSEGGIDGAVLRSQSFLLRYLSRENDDRLLVVNLGSREELRPVPEPLLAPPSDCDWEILWTSESHRYGGPGAVDIETDENGYCLPSRHCVFRPRRRTKPRKQPKRH